MYLHVFRQVRETVSIPIAVKLSPCFSSVAFTAQHLARAGANGLVLFNRFYQPDLDIAILYGRVDADLAITSGVHTHEDVLKAMMASALLENGPARITQVLEA
ncbi:MAG TPA: hypothetical protein VK464_23355 [Symbiobacteriaceae bacterium]|jgi:dihydroorotate dehydrogenase (fumarate)|nr:hypothetical protein [Symbiobacteriaceae bacterium]